MKSAHVADLWSAERFPEPRAAVGTDGDGETPQALRSTVFEQAEEVRYFSLFLAASLVDEVEIEVLSTDRRRVTWFAEQLFLGRIGRPPAAFGGFSGRTQSWRLSDGLGRDIGLLRPSVDQREDERSVNPSQDGKAGIVTAGAVWQSQRRLRQAQQSAPASGIGGVPWGWQDRSLARRPSDARRAESGIGKNTRRAGRAIEVARVHLR